MTIEATCPFIFKKLVKISLDYRIFNIGRIAKNKFENQTHDNKNQL